MKHRAENKPFAAFLPSLTSIKECIPVDLPETARIFAERFCPGPVTLVVPDGNHYTFGFRIPDHPFIYRLLTVYEKPLASTSANLSGVPAALSVDEALSTMDGTPDLAVDGVFCLQIPKYPP